MKSKTNKIIAFTALALFASSAFAVDSSVKGHTKKTSSYAASHKSKAHNHSTKTKTHPHPAKKGTIDHPNKNK